MKPSRYSTPSFRASWIAAGREESGIGITRSMSSTGITLRILSARYSTSLSRARGIRDRHNDVDVLDRDLLADLVGQVFAHAQAGRIHRGAVDDGVRTGEVHVLEGAGVQRRILGALARVEHAVVIDEHG